MEDIFQHIWANIWRREQCRQRNVIWVCAASRMILCLSVLSPNHISCKLQLCSLFVPRSLLGHIYFANPPSLLVVVEFWVLFAQYISTEPSILMGKWHVGPLILALTATVHIIISGSCVDAISNAKNVGDQSKFRMQISSVCTCDYTVLSHASLSLCLQDIMNSRDLDESGSLNFEEFLMAMPANLVNIPEDEHKYAIQFKGFKGYTGPFDLTNFRTSSQKCPFRGFLLRGSKILNRSVWSSWVLVGMKVTPSWCLSSWCFSTLYN